MEAAVGDILEFEPCAMARSEVYRWYEVFYAWSRGLVAADEAVARQIWDALAPDFRVALPDGRMMDKDQYWERLLGLYGARAGSPKSQITNLALQPISTASILATFDLVKSGVATRKFDTAILRRAPDQPSGMVWAYVHESAHSD